uniref:Filamin-A n=1 Tax=Heterorhabditis bacteriophora TaxID=37862 RepID=A0A1I7XV17_HETBA
MKMCYHFETHCNNKKNEIGTDILEVEPGVMQINFTPVHVGDHEIEVKYGGVPVTGSPFTCRAYDPANIKVGTIPKGLLDKPVYFTVDASEAGVGNLEVAVNEGRVPSMAHALGQHKYDISFVPKENCDHTITVRFNNEPVPGSPFICHLVSAAQASASGPGLERVPVDELTEIKIQTDGTSEDMPEIRIRDPQSNDLPVNITRSKNDETLCIATYTPKCVGNHQIDITLSNEPIAGSPFTAKAYDARMARLTPCEKAVIGKPCTFTIDAARAGAGNMEIIVSVDNRNVPNFVQAEGQAKFKVSFTPQEAKEHVISVRFNGVSVPGSPMRCSVEPAQNLITSNLLTGMAPDINERIGLVKELQSAQSFCECLYCLVYATCPRDNCLAPDGKKIPVNIEMRDQAFYAQFTPVMKGPHEIEIILDDIKVNELPIVMTVHEEKLELATVCLVGKKYSFDIFLLMSSAVSVFFLSLQLTKYNSMLLSTVDADCKGSVRVDIHDPNGKLLPVQIEELSEGRVRASCRFKQLVSEMKKEIVGESVEQRILIDPSLEGEVNVEIKDPDRIEQPVILKKVSDTLWAVSWTPKVNDKSGKIRVMKKCAVNKNIGWWKSRLIDYALSGASSVSVEVRAGSKSVPCGLKRVKPGLLVCTFTPITKGVHYIDVLIDGLILTECPYECYINDVGSVRAKGDALCRAQRARTARFEVSINDATRGELDVVVLDPRGGPLPVRCYKQQDDSYWVEFTPEHTGMHTVEVTFGDIAVAGSPFHCEVVDPKKVVVKGLNEPLLLRHATTISVDRQNAGAGDLQIEVTDPSGNPLKMEMIKSPGGEDRFTFLPNKIGPHKVNIRISGFQVSGYPQTILVAEQEQPCVYGSAIDQSIKINEPASLIFDPKKANGGLKIGVLGPNDNKVRYNVMKRPNGTSEVVFYPDEVGTYVVSIDFNNKPVTGSPFTVHVIDPSKVIVNDLDMDRDGSLLLRLAQQNVFDVDATAAGPGKLRAEVRDADSALIGDGPAVDDLGYGKYRVSFIPKQPGRYSIYLYWNELAVESAFPVRARSSEDQPTTSKEMIAPIAHSREKSTSSYEDDIARVMVRGDGLHVAQLKKQNEFIIDGSDLTREGRITSTLYGSKADVPVRVQQLGHNVYKATYTPLMCGTYELHILWNGKHVKGSPFKVSADSFSSPADLIVVDNSSLKIGIINEDIKTVIDTRRAGPGQLSAQCMGPVKLAYCELYDHRDGTYTLSVRPSEVGKHTLIIKYNEQHVRGSPFLIHVSLPPDPSKVRVYGPGIEHGILSMFKSNFIVETRGAGAGQLTVRVRGPKGAFNVEMQREKKNERTIHCKYEPKEPGDYQVEVKWHGEHVPGSPFLVMIVDTEQELSRFLRGEAPSPTPATPFVPPGWVGPPPMFPPMAGPRQRLMGPPVGHPLGPPPPGALLPYAAPAPLPPRHKTKYH